METGQNNFQEQAPSKKWRFYKSWIFWVAMVLSIAFAGAVYYISLPDLSIDEESLPFITINGFVDQIDQENNSLVVWWWNEGETDSGLTYVDEGEMIAKWEDDWDIQPHHPRLLRGGEEVVIIPTQVWDEFDTEVYIDSLEILSGLRDQ